MVSLNELHSLLDDSVTLSDSEFEVLRLIASGKTVGEIAGILSLTDKTISTYRARILEKMGMKTNDELNHHEIQNTLVE
jgi:two-component system, NarL family, invasion response regulator UvrY